MPLAPRHSLLATRYSLPRHSLLASLFLATRHSPLATLNFLNHMQMALADELDDPAAVRGGFG
jgi:hypothetical protein